MKILKNCFVGRVQPYHGALIALLLTGSVFRSEATIYTISSSPSVVTFDTTQGLTGWQENGGVNQLSLQSLYYSVNGGAVSLLTSPTVVQLNSATLTATYSVSGVVSVADRITVNGNTLGEQIKFTNLSGSPTTISIFQYSDFVLGGVPGQTLNMTVINTTQATASQSGGGATLTWSGQATGGSVEVQANGSGAPFGPFNGSATALNNTNLSASGTAVFGYEFDAINLVSSNSLTASETAALTVPEPSSVALICSGMIALALLNRQRRGTWLWP
jgi:hypothetical protein